MNKKFLFLILAFILSTSIFAQKRIYFCEDYTPEGEPIGTSSVWNIKQTGGNVYFLYNNDGENITTSSVYIIVDKLDGASYKEYSLEVIKPDKFKSKLLFDYKFTEAGEYKVTFSDANCQSLSIEYITIKIKDNTEKEVDKISLDYYTEAKVIFCDRVDKNGNAQTAASAFTISRATGGFVDVLINNVNAFKTKELTVDIWHGDDYNYFVETKHFPVEEDWKWSDFKYTFTKAGKYKFAVYTKDEVYIQTGYVSIVYE